MATQIPAGGIVIDQACNADDHKVGVSDREVLMVNVDGTVSHRVVFAWEVDA